MTLTVLQCFGMGLGSSPHLHAQEPPQDTVTATTLFDTQFDGPPPGPATVSVATIALAPGQATLPLEGGGSLLILVESGSATLVIDHAIDGIPASTGDGTGDGTGGPELIYRYHLPAGQRVTLPAIGTIQFRNDGDESSTLLLLSLVAEGDPLMPTVLARS